MKKTFDESILLFAWKLPAMKHVIGSAKDKAQWLLRRRCDMCNNTGRNLFSVDTGFPPTSLCNPCSDVYETQLGEIEIMKNMLTCGHCNETITDNPVLVPQKGGDRFLHYECVPRTS